jgi:hypothetical protein
MGRRTIMVELKTNDSALLLKKIKAAIDAGHVTTWSYDKDGDFTHTPEQWRFKAWLRPTVALGSLKFGMVSPRGMGINKEVYAVYHGRIAEMLLAHFDNDFESVTSSALAAAIDTVVAA